MNNEVGMDSKLGTDPELLWPLLLVQIVYDELTKSSKLSFTEIARIYREHPLLPYNAPVLETSGEAEKVYSELLKEYHIDTKLDAKTQAANLAEPLYTNFHANLVGKMKEDVQEFIKAYRAYESDTQVPKEERLTE